LHSTPPAKAILAPFGSRTSVSVRRRACKKSRLSIIAAVRVRRLTSELQRGRPWIPPPPASNGLPHRIAANIAKLPELLRAKG